jgi:hypothetical protein
MDRAVHLVQPAAQLARLMDGYLSTQLLYVAAELGVADALADGPRTSEDLAAALRVDPDALYRVLRGLAADGVLDELPGGRFGLTRLSDLLRDGEPGSQRGAVLARGRLYYRALDGLLGAVRAGGTPFARAHGTSFFEYLAAHPAEAADFQASMAGRSSQEATAVVAAYDFSGIHRLVDVGGGRGILLAAILAAAPSLSGVLFDRPEVVEQSRAWLATTAADGRWDVVGGDFFEAVPAGGDAYLLSRVLHDWDDASALRILGSCRRAIPDRGRLLLVEAVLPERAADQTTAIRMDIHMLALVGGHERTATEYGALLAQAGFACTRVINTDSPAGIAIIEAVPAGVAA